MNILVAFYNIWNTLLSKDKYYRTNNHPLSKFIIDGSNRLALIQMADVMANNFRKSQDEVQFMELFPTANEHTNYKDLKLVIESLGTVVKVISRKGKTIEVLSPIINHNKCPQILYILKKSNKFYPLISKRLAFLIEYKTQKE